VNGIRAWSVPFGAGSSRSASCSASDFVLFGAIFVRRFEEANVAPKISGLGKNKLQSLKRRLNLARSLNPPMSVHINHREPRRLLTGKRITVLRHLDEERNVLILR